QSDHLGIANQGLFFTTLTLMALTSRLIAGKTSDIYGRIPVMRIAIVLLAASYTFMGFVSTPAQLLIASGCIGFSAGIAGPAVFAWTIDRADDERRARAMAAVYIGLEVAIGSGALMSAYVYANNPNNFMRTFLIVGVFTLVGLLFLRKRKA
ncbi:MAG: MFS transporter, partial [Bacteroidota bacterium]